MSNNNSSNKKFIFQSESVNSNNNNIERSYFNIENILDKSYLKYNNREFNNSSELKDIIQDSEEQESEIFSSSEQSNNDSIYENNNTDSDDNKLEKEDERDNNTDILNSEYQEQIYTKYINKNYLMNKKYKDELKENIKKYDNELEKSVIKNSLIEVKKLIENGITINKSNNNNIIKLCKNNCDKRTCSKECFKNSLYISLRNFNRCIKTIYHNLFKLIVHQSKFRILCKCCIIHNRKDYLDELDKNFVLKKKNINEGINTKLEPIIILELQINYLINKFMSIIGLLPCECEYKNKYYIYYTNNYLNFHDIIKIYTITIPQVIKLLKVYSNIKENNEELNFIKDERCIHEDIRYNNLTYCLKKNNLTNNNKIINELIMNLDLLNEWIIENIKITINLYNQQSLEQFKYYISNNINDKNITNIFNKIYPINNELLDVNYTSNKNNLINNIIENYKNINSVENLIILIIKQIEIKNKNNLSKNLINYVSICFKRSNINIGVQFIKYIKNLKEESNLNLLNYIFDTLIDCDLSIEKKITYLKIINKNKINVIEYDFVNKLIDNNSGDDIILEFNKEENTLFNINDYKNENYIINIIKKCIKNIKINILDYVLFNLEKSIKYYKIDTIIIFLLNIPKKKEEEYLYIDILKIIIKYNNNFNSIITVEMNTIKNMSILQYCIKYEFNLCGKLFIKEGFNLLNSHNYLKTCIDNNNSVLYGYIIEKEPSIINILDNNKNIINYLFDKIKRDNKNLLFRFVVKTINPIINGLLNKNKIINYQDENNELFEFKILNSDLTSNEKILIFNFIKDIINPLEISIYKSNDKNVNTLNYPLILHSLLLNEYEITFMLLNNLLKNGIIKKNIRNSNDTMTIFDYYHINTDININFVPIIFKYIKDNHTKYEIFDEKLLSKINDLHEIDKIPIELILMITKIIIFIIIYETKDIKLKNYKKKNKIIIDNQYSEINKYMEITVDNNDNILETNIETNIEENNIKSINKNIWIMSSNKNKKLEDSDISESDILFGME